MMGFEAIEIVLIVIFWIVVLPLTTLLHEIGHGIGGILISKERAMVFLGPIEPSNTKTFHIGRMDFHIKWAYFGFCSIKKYHKLNAMQRIVISAGGPAMSLLIVFASIFLLFFDFPYQLKNFVTAIAIVNAWQFLCTAVPIINPTWYKAYSGMSSDGYQIVKAWKEYRQERKVRL
ncbi:hypothetical protein [Virgibacillus halodenitrificans]|uniref:hypothetical protein n=1 Tax=Virgibacillus halodenitrificans TaxID=1482 RepID=UPI0002F77277|nr:hypothetical protein [Virgibacillus halodenitrificans]